MAILKKSEYNLIRTIMRTIYAHFQQIYCEVVEPNTIKFTIKDNEFISLSFLQITFNCANFEISTTPYSKNLMTKADFWIKISTSSVIIRQDHNGHLTLVQLLPNTRYFFNLFFFFNLFGRSLNVLTEAPDECFEIIPELNKSNLIYDSVSLEKKDVELIEKIFNTPNTDNLLFISLNNENLTMRTLNKTFIFGKDISKEVKPSAYLMDYFKWWLKIIKPIRDYEYISFAKSPGKYILIPFLIILGQSSLLIYLDSPNIKYSFLLSAASE